jgi:excisionase family DNA binding protein
MLTVADAALLLNVSKDWLYRHRRELPHARVGKNIRFDSLLLVRHFQSKYPVRTGSRLEPKGVTMGLKLPEGLCKKAGEETESLVWGLAHRCSLTGWWIHSSADQEANWDGY